MRFRFLPHLAKTIRHLLPCLTAIGLLAGNDTWVEVRSPHFVVESNSGIDKAKEAALAFEEIRAVFQTAFAGIQVDPGQPMLIFILKDDASLKTFLLDYANAKNRARLGGWFQSTRDTNYAFINTDSPDNSETAYHVLFHEYTHAIVRMNFGRIPTWLNEGFAEFFGNTLIKRGETDLGPVTEAQIRLLRGSAMIHLDSLFRVDEHSPLYSEWNRASMFYAESWVLVHFLQMDPWAAKGRLLPKYLEAVEGGMDGVTAAHQAFGDFPEFEKRLSMYIRRQGFGYQRLKPMAKISDASLTVRTLSLAEQLALRADYLARSGHAKEALPIAQQAVEADPKLAATHEALGYALYMRADFAEASREFRAVASNGHDFRPSYYLAETSMRNLPDIGVDQATTITLLERVVALNPDFAQGQASLASAYMRQSENRERAIPCAIRATQLDRAQPAYLVSLGWVYLDLGQNTKAKEVGVLLVKAARTPEEMVQAQNFASAVEKALQNEESEKHDPPGAIAIVPSEDPDTGN